MAYKKIGDYGIIGNGVTVALVGKDGAVDWMCLPCMDSPSVFAALLDDEKGGRFAIRPAAAWDSAQNYLLQTNILKTLFRTASGQVEILDFMPAGPAMERDKDNDGRLVRRIKGIAGEVELALECTARFDYACRKPRWSKADKHSWWLEAEGERLSLFCTQDIRWRGERASVHMRAEETLWLVLTYQPATDVALNTPALEALLEATKKYWTDWTRTYETGKYPYDGFWQPQLDRSALTLKLLQMRETGAVAAAATTSLPALIYGERNWDYRFSWIRDTSMTFSALLELGHLQEVSDYLDWLKGIADKDKSGHIEVVYQLRKPEPPRDETILKHLSGYKGSAPVRIGQFAINQCQHDIYGDMLNTIFAVSHFIGKIDLEHWECFRPLVDYVVDIWREKDDGIWEARIGPQHYTHSKVMCWVALDRGIKVAQHYGFPGDVARWQAERDAVREDILSKGYNRERGTFTQHYDTDAVDAALLLIPLMGFLPIDDPKVEGTIKTIERELLNDGVMLRYKVYDGLAGQENGFMICLFWYLHCLIKQGRSDAVEEHLRNIDDYANHVGLFGEQFDPHLREITGNFPQAYSHIGYATVVLSYLEAKKPHFHPVPLPLFSKIKLLFKGKLLNPVPPGGAPEAKGNPSEEMKRVMNILRGHFYDGHQQRVDYASIKESDYYNVFRKAVSALCAFDPGSLVTDDERLAFWINVYNTFVIHGVIELRITESVKEVPLFFKRIQYLIGHHIYTPDDIEHGILRGNAVPRYCLWKQFRSNDPRIKYTVEKCDPRIHFALVCASRTCPPIEVYEASHLDQQLETSARVFINGTTHLDEKKSTLWASEIFKWYESDFDRTGPDLARYLARYLYDGDLARRIGERAESLRICFTPYDWRLNR